MIANDNEENIYVKAAFPVGNIDNISKSQIKENTEKIKINDIFFNIQKKLNTKNLDIEIKFSHVVVAANGYKKVKSAQIAKISEDKKNLINTYNIACDCICVSGFWTPTIHLASQSGNKTKYNENIDAFVPHKPKQAETTLGSANGIFTLEETLKTSFDKGYELSKEITKKNNSQQIPKVLEKMPDVEFYWVGDGQYKKRIIDRLNKFENKVFLSL